MRPQVGQIIHNKYRLVRLIGDGGMGSVYEAKHEVLGTSVALKFLHPELTRRAGLVQRFLQEARVSAAIQSPHVVRVIDVDQTTEGLAYIVLEYLEGRSLQALYEHLYQAKQRLSFADAMSYAMQMLDGVEAAHRAGIVHRDLKPDNVMITTGAKGEAVVKLLDFGIAKLKVSGAMDKGLTRPGVMMGTPEYMAPEQAYSADAVDARADIFSLGVMVFEMLAGRRPADGDDPMQIASQYLEGTIAKLSSLVPSIPTPLAEAVHKAIAAKPEARFDDVAAFRRALAPFAQPTSVTDSGPRAPEVAAAIQPLAEAPVYAPVPRTLPPDDGADSGVGLQAHAAAPLGTGLPEASPLNRPGGTAIVAAPPPMSAQNYYAAGVPGTADGGSAVPATTSPAPVVKAGSSMPFMAILGIAGLIAALVVGGLYAAHEYAKSQDRSDDPPPAPAPVVTVTSTPADDSAPVPPPIASATGTSNHWQHGQTQPANPGTTTTTPASSASAKPGTSANPTALPTSAPSSLPPFGFPPGHDPLHLPQLPPLPLPGFTFPGTDPAPTAKPPAPRQPPAPQPQPQPTSTGHRPHMIPILVPKKSGS